jgi:hypothetical protein
MNLVAMRPPIGAMSAPNGMRVGSVPVTHCGAKMLTKGNGDPDRRHDYGDAHPNRLATLCRSLEGEKDRPSRGSAP